MVRVSQKGIKKKLKIYRKLLDILAATIAVHLGTGI